MNTRKLTLNSESGIQGQLDFYGSVLPDFLRCLENAPDLTAEQHMLFFEEKHTEARVRSFFSKTISLSSCIIELTGKPDKRISGGKTGPALPVAARTGKRILYYRFLYFGKIRCYHNTRTQGYTRKGKGNDPQTVFRYLQI